MKLLIFYGLYEGEKTIAPHALGQLLTILAGHEVDVLILDDASPSRVGEQTKARFTGQGPGRVDVLRLEHSTGYRGSIDRMFTALHWVTQTGRTYDYVLRVDADIHFCRADLASLFTPGRLPMRGIIGQPLVMRRRDFVQVLADVLPAGFRRHRTPDGKIEHKWELQRCRPVWWHTIGWRALRHGFRGVIVPGSFIVIAGATLTAFRDRGWLDRLRENLGLVFGDDTMLSIATRAVGHPVVDVRTLLPDWSCSLFIGPTITATAVRSAGHYFIHPMKDAVWANELRQALPLAGAIPAADHPR